MAAENERLSRATDRVVQGGFLFLIVATPLMFGSVYTWAQSLMQLTAALMWLAWLVRLFLLGKARPEGVPNVSLLLPVLLFFALILLQLLPLPGAAIKALSPKTAALYETFLGDLACPGDPGSPGGRPETTAGVGSRDPASARGEELAPLPEAAGTADQEAGEEPPSPARKAAVQAEGGGQPAAVARDPDDPQSARSPGVQVPEANTPGAKPSTVADLSEFARVQVPEANIPGAKPPLGENRSLTLFRKGTRTEALLLLTYLSLFFLLINYQPDGTVRDFLKRIVATVVLTGFLVALIGLLQRVLGAELIYWLWKPRQQTRQPFMGPYVNANHFAGYLEMTIPLSIGLFLSWAGKQRRRASRKSTDLVATIQSPEYNKIALGVVGIAILLTALFLSISRAGIFSFLVTMFVLFLLLGRQEGRYRPARWQALRGPCWAAFVLCFLLFGVLALVVFALKVENTGGFSKTARFQVWGEALRMFTAFPLLGIGLNAFSVISPYFKTAESPFLFTHVENDYLQLLVETGILGFLLAGLFFFLFFRKTAGVFRWRRESFVADQRARAEAGQAAVPKRSSFRSRRKPAREEENPYPLPRVNFFLFWGCLGSLISLALHSLADFNLRIPANGLLFFLLLGLLYRLVRQNRPLFSFSRRRKDFG